MHLALVAPEAVLRFNKNRVETPFFRGAEEGLAGR